MHRLAILLALAASPAIAGPASLPDPVHDADYVALDPAEAQLGRLLFYDAILSGNRNISCATCHHPRFATSDGVSLSLGEGGIGLGPDRHANPENMPEERIARNATALFNLGAREFTRLFHDGRIETDPDRKSGLRTPLEDDMTLGFSGVLSAQTMFPVLSQDEMAGHYSENEVSQAVRQGRITGPGGAWDLISARVAALPGYGERFDAVYPEIAAGRPIAFTDISNAIAAFVAYEWRSDRSPFDAHLRGETPLSGPAAEGLDLFYGDAGCASCHSGPFQTDHEFHAMNAPQIGPGKHARFEDHNRDEGRLRVTGQAADAYAFRTPSLRNVARTSPYGHAGAQRDLAAFLKRHGQPSAPYDRDQAILPALPGAADWHVTDSPEQSRLIAAASEITKPLTDPEITALLAFLDSLTDPTALEGPLGIPERVPSGLPIDR